MDRVRVNINDNSGDVIKTLNDVLPPALEKCALVAEGYAVKLCPVDTGRLRNSITHATDMYYGKSNYADSEGNTYSDAKARVAPEKGTAYIGTNVEYAPYVEMGTVHTTAQPFLKPAVANHIDQYKQILRDSFKGD